MIYYQDMVLNETRESRSVPITESEIINFAKDWDPQPFHIDPVAAKAYPTGLIASGVHTIAWAVKLSNELIGETPLAVIAGLGWDEVRMHAPVRPGDQLRVKTWVAEKRESKSKANLGIVTSVIQVVNQDDVVALSFNISTLMMKRPDA